MNESKLAGRTSVAQLILERTKYFKPAVQVANPTNDIPLAPQEPAKQDSIISSDKHKQMIFDEAKENAAYYLECQKIDGNKHPWFRYVRKQSQYSEFVMLTTEMAQALLDSIWIENEGNRKLKIALKESYRRDIDNDRWIPSDESIGIDYNGVVYNGRHRMTALVESGKTYPFYITFNSLEEAKFTVDSGAKRTSSEKLKLIIDTKLGNRTTGFCKAIMKGILGKTSKSKYTETEIAEFAHKWEPIISWVSLHLPIARAEVQAALAKAYIWYGPEKIEPFCQRLKDIKFTEDGDPAKALYVALTKAKVNRINISLVAYKKTLASIEAIILGKPLNRLYEREEDIFQWQEGWELPQGSWWASQNK